MAISIEELERAASEPIAMLASTISEAKELGLKTAFICHSHLDVHLARGMARLLSKTGWTAYIDWLDDEMPPVPNRQTAQKLRRKIIKSEYFIFLATANSMSSRWCPWELGYADGRKEPANILIVPTKSGKSTYGNEYLQLYRQVDFSKTRKLAVWQPEQTARGVLVENL